MARSDTTTHTHDEPRIPLIVDPELPIKGINSVQRGTDRYTPKKLKIITSFLYSINLNQLRLSFSFSYSSDYLFYLHFLFLFYYITQLIQYWLERRRALGHQTIGVPWTFTISFCVEQICRCPSIRSNRFSIYKHCYLD